MGCVVSHVTSLNFDKISDYFSEMVQYRGIITMEDYRKSYVAYRMAQYRRPLVTLKVTFAV